MLDDRSTELAALEPALAADGAVVVIEAPAGGGKSALLDAVEARAREAGRHVLRIAHGPADRGIPYGTLRALSGGLAPLALLVDDAQWADRDSLAALARLARRIRDVPVLLVLAARPGVALAEIAGIRGVTVLELAGGDRWLQGELATGGPLSAAGRIELRRRLGQLSAGDRHVARALAILGDGAEPHRIAEVAAVPVEDLVGVRERLAAGGLCTPRGRRFVHGLVARGVRDEMPAAVRASLHRAAAAALRRDGEPATAVAHHLLRCGPAADPDATATLREAASANPRTAVAYLERALVERAAGDDRAAILCELAAAEFHAGLPDPRRRLRAALATNPSAGARREIDAQLAAFEAVDRLGSAATLDPAAVADEPLGLLVRARELIARDRVADAERTIARLRETTGDSVPLRAAATWAAAELALRAGRLTEAEAAAHEALHAGAARGVAASAAEVLALALIERGALADAREVVAGGLPRARLSLAEGDFEAAAEQARALGRDGAWIRALALAQLGRLAEAAAVADEDVGVARAAGGPTALARALHARTVSEPDPARRAGLADTALIVFRGPAVLVRAALQIEHASALVRLGRRVEARDGLRAALATADAAGAAPLAERARRELVASGARPRRAAIAGAAALTPRQRQICELAAAGKSNRAIAHALFLSIKTVETHLARAYGTLGVADRAGMIAAITP
jgi:DNA-binding CsgD family transcriptional regulator